MHAEAIDDPKLKLLAFEDRWHFVAILCLKSDGLLDKQAKSDLLDRMVAAKLGLAARDADEARRRLIEVGLITEKWQPIGWDKRQYASDNSTARVRKYRQKNQQCNGVKRFSNGDVTPPDTDTDTDIGRGKKRSSKFSPPTVEQVAAYVAERRSGVDPQRFVDFYAAKGWYVGKNKMRDWQAAVRTWEKSDTKVDPHATSNRV